MLSHVIKFLFVVCLSAMSGCVGLKDQIQGTLSVRAPFLIQSEPRSIYFENGNLPAKVQLSYGIYGFKSPRATISVQGKEYEFVIPRETISEKNHSIDASAAQLNQSFGIQAKSQVRTLRTWSEERSEGCTHCSFCSQMVTRTDSDGNSTTGLEFTYNCGCSGTEDVIREYQLHERVYDLQFKSTDGDFLGRFIGSGEQFTTSRVTETLVSCR